MNGNPTEMVELPRPPLLFNLHPVKSKGEYPIEEDEETSSRLDGGPIPSIPKSNYELFNRSNFNIRY